MNDENKSERPSASQSSGLPWPITEPEGPAESEVHHFGYIENLNPIPALKKLLERIYPPRRHVEE